MIRSYHWVQHTPSTVFTQDGLSSLYSHDYKLTLECRFSFQRAYLHNRLPPASSGGELRGNVTSSHSDKCEVTNRWIQSQLPAHFPSNASILTQSWPSHVSPNLPNDGLEAGIIMASNRISKLAQTHLPSSPNHGRTVNIQPRLITVSKWVSELLDLSLEMHFHSRSIMASTFAQSWPPSSCPHSLACGLQAHLSVHTISASKCISQFTQSSSSGGPWVAPMHHLLPVWIYHVQMGSEKDKLIHRWEYKPNTLVLKIIEW